MQRSTEELLGRLLAALDSELGRAVELRHRLHAHPELSHAERETAATVAEQLPVECAEVAGTGLLARVGAAHGAPIAVRAELDGLPIEERTGAPFSAAGDAMHACGHDVHMAALVALARAAHSSAKICPPRCWRSSSPARRPIPPARSSLPRRARALAPAAVLAAHVHPELPWGSVALDPGAVNASSDSVEITVEGEPSHGAYPHHGRDPVLAISQIVVALHAQIGRRIDPHGAAVLTSACSRAGPRRT